MIFDKYYKFMNIGHYNMLLVGLLFIHLQKKKNVKEARTWVRTI